MRIVFSIQGKEAGREPIWLNTSRNAEKFTFVVSKGCKVVSICRGTKICK